MPREDTQFKPGKSGNLSGRAKDYAEFSEAARKVCLEGIAAVFGSPAVTSIRSSSLPPGSCCSSADTARPWRRWPSTWRPTTCSTASGRAAACPVERCWEAAHSEGCG
jgi:hypothetical protein